MKSFFFAVVGVADLKKLPYRTPQLAQIPDLLPSVTYKITVKIYSRQRLSAKLMCDSKDVAFASMKTCRCGFPFLIYATSLALLIAR